MVLSNEINEIKKIDFSRIIVYLGLNNSIRWGGPLTTGDTLFVALSLKSPNSTSKVTLVSLTSDNDSYGLQNEQLEFYYQLTYLDNTVTIVKFDTINLSEFNRFPITDNQGQKYVFQLYKTYNLKDLANYENIRLLTIGIKDTSSSPKGNEVALIVGYEQEV